MKISSYASRFLRRHTLMLPGLIVLLACAQSALAQKPAPKATPSPTTQTTAPKPEYYYPPVVELWAAEGDDIYNTNLNHVGIGTNYPATQLHVATESSAVPRGVTNSQHSEDNNAALFTFRKSRGAITSPAAAVNGDNIGNLYAEGYDGASYISGGRIRFSIDGAVSSGNVPTGFQFFTGSNGSGVERMRITSAGNVGIGTAAPTATLDVAGTSKAQTFSLNGISAEKAFVTQWNNGVPNQKVQVYWPASTQVDGIYEITVTGHYWYSNSNGGIRKRIVINGRNIGIINMEEVEVPFRMGFTGNTNTISNIMWDGANSRYYFIVSNLDNAQNAITIHVKSITPGATPANADSLNISPIYTTDATVYPQLYTSFMSSNVGVGTTTPGFRLDVQGGQLNAAGGLCIAGDCKTAWSQLASQWATSGSNVYYNSGNVGIGTNSPVTKLQVSGGTRVDGTNGRVYVGTGAIANYRGLELIEENPTTFSIRHHDPNVAWQNIAINPYGGNVGIGTLAPATKLHVVGDGTVTGNLTVSGNIAAKYQDVAEWVESSQALAAGTVVVLDHTRSNQVVASTEAYDTRVAGVISSQPGIALGEAGRNKVLVATTGRVRIKVDATRAPIRIGDLLVTSDQPGFAMKSLFINVGGMQIHRPGTLIGKALEPLANGQGEILVLLSLQ